MIFFQKIECGVTTARVFFTMTYVSSYDESENRADLTREEPLCEHRLRASRQNAEKAPHLGRASARASSGERPSIPEPDWSAPGGTHPPAGQSGLPGPAPRPDSRQWWFCLRRLWSMRLRFFSCQHYTRNLMASLQPSRSRIRPCAARARLAGPRCSPAAPDSCLAGWRRQEGWRYR